MSKENMNKTYWFHNGKHQAKANVLDKLVPTEGPCSDSTPQLENFRVASNYYYDIYNNGGCNYAKHIRNFFGLPVPDFDLEDLDEEDCSDIAEFSESQTKLVEAAMDRIVLAAFKEYERSKVLA